jgi:hypothetical protein
MRHPEQVNGPLLEFLRSAECRLLDGEDDLEELTASSAGIATRNRAVATETS